MAGSTTRKSVQAFKDNLKEDDYCIMPGEIVKRWLEDASTQQEILISTQAKLVEAVERIAIRFEAHADVKENQTRYNMVVM